MDRITTSSIFMDGLLEPDILSVSNIEVNAADKKRARIEDDEEDESTNRISQNPTNHRKERAYADQMVPGGTKGQTKKVKPIKPIQNLLNQEEIIAKLAKDILAKSISISNQDLLKLLPSLAKTIGESCQAFSNGIEKVVRVKEMYNDETSKPSQITSAITCTTAGIEPRSTVGKFIEDFFHKFDRMYGPYLTDVALCKDPKCWDFYHRQI
ncbi:hypothetical protein S40285_10700 [Stachybotrys chlorohalonatus IBT 40285]|uniref:Uncharacterized protein n=1 Tax=Stachybotrys chlorohalonatus (strain IBT 40285) TaxID=1283841 RepID=A0A084QVQ5_STAC4|nr:hypothetical protein S40285_10700 [Stachybotrys chlorohalonata IBT 40285]